MPAATKTISREIKVRNIDEPIIVTDNGFTWNGQIDVHPETPPHVLLTIVQDMLKNAEAKGLIQDLLVQFFAKNSKLAMAFERNGQTIKE